MLIRPAVIADARGLAELAARTFTQAFGTDNRPEDLAAHLEEFYGETQQQREIGDPTFRTLLALDGETPVGFAQLRHEAPPPCVVPADGFVELYRFYLDRSVHGTGTAQRLMAEAKAVARDMGARNVWLGVWEKNPRAIAFYSKCGFVDRGFKIFEVGADKQRDRVMVAVV